MPRGQWHDLESQAANAYIFVGLSLGKLQGLWSFIGKLLGLWSFVGANSTMP